MIDTFHWILPQQLAGSAQPGWMSEMGEDLEWLRKVGIKLVVTLTESPLEVGLVEGLRFRHFPIRDMGIPGPRETHQLCREVFDSIQREEPVLLHCKAGLGRTGTMLACYLVSQGMEAEAAISRVRCVSTYYIQTQTQEMFVSHYQLFLDKLEEEGVLQR